MPGRNNRKPGPLTFNEMDKNGGNNSRIRQQQQQKEDEDPNRPLVMKKRPVGLVNLGNTCFMNAALQCLCRTSGLLEKLELLTKEPTLTFTGSGLAYNDEQVHNELRFKLIIPPESIIRKMVHLLRQMTQGGGGETVNPRIVHHVMTRNFGAGLQHDSHELLRHMLDKLKKEQIRAFRIALMDLFGISHDEAGKILQTDPQKAQELKEWDRKLYHSTVIDEIFGGELLTTRTCLECGAVKNSTEEFLDISLPIRVVKSGSENKNANLNNRYFPSNELTTINRTLQECFQCFVEPEILSGNNKVDCERCHEQKLNKIKAGVPVEQVFPPEEPSSSSQSNSVVNNKFARNQKQQQAQQQQQQKANNQKQSNRKKKKRKTRKEKMAEAPFAENASPEKEENSSNSEADVPELEKITDEGYAEDYKDSDDSTGVSAGDNDQTPSDEAQDEDGENDGDREDEEEDEDADEAEEKEEAIPRPVKPEIPKSTKTACKRQTMIYRPPKNLTVHLKRFTVSARGYTQKLTDHVKFKEYIDIRDFVTTAFPSDDQTSQISSNSWSFEEMSKEVDVALGGASGDSVDPSSALENSSDRFIVAPALSTPLSIKSNEEGGGDFDVPGPVLRTASPSKPEPETPGPSGSNLIIQPSPIISDISSSTLAPETDTITAAEDVECGPLLAIEPAPEAQEIMDDGSSFKIGDENTFTMPVNFDSGNDMDDEPPPYGGVSPTLEDYSSDRPRLDVDVTLPDPDPANGWSVDYKSTQGIAEWSAKGLDEGGLEIEPEPMLDNTLTNLDLEASPATTDVVSPLASAAIPLPPPLPTSQWSDPTPASVDLPPVIPLGYTSIGPEQEVTKDTEDDDDDVMNLGPTLLGDSLDDASSSTRILAEPEPEPVKLDPNGINYRLYGIVEHGGSLNWGHYVAYVRVDSEWYYISDSYVSKSDIKTVLDRDPYILFYERVP